MYIAIHVTHHERDHVRVEAREKLTSKPDVGVAIGEGPDGLPLVLRISRHRDVRLPILSVLGRSRSEDLPIEVAGAIETLQHLVTKESLKSRLIKHEGKLGYVSTRPIGSMLGASLFAKALGDVGPLMSGGNAFHDDGASSGGSGSERAAMTSAGVVMSAREIKHMIGTAGASRRLFVPLPDGRCRVITESDTHGNTHSNDDGGDDSRPILFERLSRLANVRFGFCDAGGEWQSAPFDEMSASNKGGAYREAVRSAESVAWWIPRSSLAYALADVANQVSADIHRRGLVHGDMKPANMLIAGTVEERGSGPCAIDSLNVESGRIATVCTPSWAAPEQVTVRPVTSATDVYALGLVLARLIGAVVFGEERTFVVPVGGNEKRRMQVLADAQVFIDPTPASPAVGAALEAPIIQSDAAMKAYASFITRCVSFDPTNRPRDGAAFASELRDLLGRHPFILDSESGSGWFRLGWLAGKLHRTVDLLGTTQPAWVITDGTRF